MSLLASAVEGWSPGPVTDTAVVAPGPAAAFAALLDRPAPPVEEGRSGEMLLLTVRGEYREAGRLLLVEEQDVVSHSRPAGSSPAPAGAGAPAPDDGGPAVEVLPDPALLFRFSALTYNAHRIHYDSPYATGVEGHPGLVVHGPLLALLLLEVVRRHVPDRSVTSAEHRLVRPAYAGTPVRATGRFDGARVSPAAGAVGAPASATGTVTLGPTP